MSHRNVRLMIETAVKRIADDIKFSYQTQTDFNQDQKNSFTFVNLIPLTASTRFSDNNVSNYSKRWNVIMAFYKYDTQGSPPEDYTKILDDTDKTVDKFIIRLNQEDNIILENMSQEAFIKDMADILTGQALTFQMTLTDDIDYCVDCP